MKRFHVLENFALDLHAKRIAEIGVHVGKTTAYLLNKLPDVHLIAVDTWSDDLQYVRDYIINGKLDYDAGAIEAEFLKRTQPYRNRLTVLKMPSVEAAAQVPDDSLDLVFIDANHEEASCRADIVAWFPKVRVGGILSGHDFQPRFPGVMKAVSGFFPKKAVGLYPNAVWCVTRTWDMGLPQ